VVRLFASLLLVLLVLLTALGGGACTRDDATAVPGVRLGMSPRDVRDRFVPGGEGTFQTHVGAGDDTVLEWTGKDGGLGFARARFEFHLGMLVAVRARTTAPIDAEQVSLTPRTVTVRAPAEGGGTSLVVLARDCPTHKDEAEGWASKTR
jgi:hypothetical protein